MIWLPAGGAKSPPSAETIARGEHYIRMEGRETYRFATRTLATTALDVDPDGRPEPRRHRPVHPAPGQHPDHRGGRQGPRPADGPDVRRTSTSTATPPRRPCRSPSPRPSTRAGSRSATASSSSRSAPGSPRARVTIEWTADPARGIAGDAAVQPEDVHVRLPVDWDSVDPIPAALAELMAQPGPVDVPLDDVVPGEPAPTQSRRSAHDRPIRQDRRRHRWLAGHRRAIACASRPRARTWRSATGATRRPPPRRRRRSRRSVGGRSPIQGDATDPEAAERGQGGARGVRQGRHPRQQRRHHPRRPDHADDRGAWPRSLETNLFGAFYVIKAVTRPMLKARAGRIINITSVSGQAGQMGQANYSVGQGRPDRPDQGHRPRARLARHHLQRRRAGVRADRADPGPARGPQGPDQRPDPARPLRHDRGDRQRRRLPRLATRRPSSRARCSPSTAAW